MRAEIKLKVWFDEAINDLYLTNFYLAAEITRLGYPRLIPGDQYPHTAGVMWDDKKKKVSFLFNECFFGNLNKEEFKYVVSHECIHVMNLHIFLFKKEVDGLKKRNKSNFDINNHVRKLNIAADCVVNDSLTNLYKLDRLQKLGWTVFTSDGRESLGDLAIRIKMDPQTLIDENPDLDPVSLIPLGEKIKVPTVPLYGLDLIEMNTEDMSVMDVFYLLPEDLSQYGVQNHDMWKSFFNPDGSLKEEFVDGIKDLIEDNMGNSALSEDDAQAIEKMKDGLENSNDKHSQKAGKSIVGKFRPVDSMGHNELNWSRLMFQLTKTRKPKDVWSRSPRKLVSTYPKIILPSIEDKEQEEIFLAIDSSASIDRKASSLFMDVARNTPRHFKVKAISFDMGCYPLDLKTKEEPRGGGGTAFDIIEEYILENYKKYPKAVVVLTDGGGNEVFPKYPRRWCWLLYGSSSTHCIGDMQRHDIKDLLK